MVVTSLCDMLPQMMTVTKWLYPKSSGTTSNWHILAAKGQEYQYKPNTIILISGKILNISIVTIANVLRSPVES